jgi:hypothetical protein
MGLLLTKEIKPTRHALSWAKTRLIHLLLSSAIAPPMSSTYILCRHLTDTTTNNRAPHIAPFLKKNEKKCIDNRVE